MVVCVCLCVYVCVSVCAIMRVHVCVCVQDTGSHIRVFTECCPQSTDRLCQLTGKPESVVHAMGRILELMDSVSTTGDLRMMFLLFVMLFKDTLINVMVRRLPTTSPTPTLV